MPSRSLGLLPFVLLHSSSALLAAAFAPARCHQQHAARSPTPSLQLGGSSEAAVAMRLTMRRGPLLRAVILGAFGSAVPAALAVDASCLDVDSATAKDLEGLRGVGPVLSKRIIEYRKNERTSSTKDGRQTWNYGNWATLMKVDGVSQQICTNNIAQVCFGGKVQKVCPMPPK